ncbi:hypothetical protein ABXS75_10970 [Roseburia hominis]
MEIRVRNVEPVVIRTLDEMARENGFVSGTGKPKREEFLRWHFRQMTLMSEADEIENKYYSLFRLMDRNQEERHKQILYMLQELERRLESEKDI